MTRYIHIAALLPSKCVRDVALRIVREENIPQVAPEQGSMMDLPLGISIVNAQQHEWINTTLNANVALINSLRDNLVQQRAHQNMTLYNDFRAQAKRVQDFLTSLPIQLPDPNFAVSMLFTEDAQKNGESSSSSSSSSASSSTASSNPSSLNSSSSSSDATAPPAPLGGSSVVPPVPPSSAPSPKSKGNAV
jgi:hypothetical protein